MWGQAAFHVFEKNVIHIAQHERYTYKRRRFVAYVYSFGFTFCGVTVKTANNRMQCVRETKFKDPHRIWEKIIYVLNGVFTIIVHGMILYGTKGHLLLKNRCATFFAASFQSFRSTGQLSLNSRKPDINLFLAARSDRAELYSVRIFGIENLYFLREMKLSLLKSFSF